MVMLRNRDSAGADPAATPKRRALELDTSSEFLSLLPAPQKKSSRLQQGLDDSFSSIEHDSPNRASAAREADSGTRSSLRTRGQRVKLEVSFSDMNGKTSSPQKTSSPDTEEKSGGYCTRKSPRLQSEGKALRAKQQADDPEEVEGSATPKRSRLSIKRRRQEEEEEVGEKDEEDGSVRRSSRSTRYKLNSRNQSVLYDRLITNTAEAVLQKMDDMKKMRRRLKSRDPKEEKSGMFTRGKSLRSQRTAEESEQTQEKENQESSEEEEDNKVDVKEVDGEEGEDNEEEDNDEEDDDDDDDDDEDDGEDEEGDDDNQKRYDFRKRKTVDRYQAPQKEPRQPRSHFKGHASPTRRRFHFSSRSPRSPFDRRRRTSGRRKHAFHSSESTSSSSSSSSSDDEKYQRRRSKKRDWPINRCLPMNLGKEDLSGIHKNRMKIGSSLADVDPMQIDRTVRFDSIGGLTRHISSLKEMVVFPLLYPEVFERFKIQPPRGCLFYGPPGTGKTLVARALANECSQGERKVSFFMRKGADCLSKWVGESERQLRLLFDQAYQMRPAIIFFDEIDGLAPVRSSRQDQIHSSIVSTLLALMDGLDSRGEVVVIGATNRLDAIDPALRRPGRFDREFLFALPDREARKDILKIHTRQWTPQPSDSFLEELADKCVGYCGADIKAVCSEAALCALRRRYPQIYSSSQKLVLDVASIAIGARDFLSAMARTVPASQRAVVSPAKALVPALRPLLAAAMHNVLGTLSRVFPHAEQGLERKRDTGLAGLMLEEDLMYSDEEQSVLCSSLSLPPTTTPAQGLLSLHRSALRQPTSFRPRLLLEGRPGSGQSSHLAPAVLHALEKFTVYTLDMAVLFGASAAAPEETCAQVFCEARRTSPSILYIPNVGQWWETVGPALRATFLSLLQDLPSFSPILLLATCSMPHHSLNTEVQALFREEYGEVYRVEVPTQQERRCFFEDLLLHQAAKPPVSKKKTVLRALEVLPVAPSAPPPQLTEKEQQRLEEQEEDTLRELRLFLRNVTERLCQDKRFKAFTKPVDLAEVPDYGEVIQQPMDLSTVLSRIDLHKYTTVKEFLHNVDLVWQNALEYNPDRDPSDRQIRHRACALKDAVHAIIRDELDEEFEKICEEIKESRSKRGFASSKFAPSYYHVLPKLRPTAAPAAVATETRSSEAAPPREGAVSAGASAAPTASTPRHTGEGGNCNSQVVENSQTTAEGGDCGRTQEAMEIGGNETSLPPAESADMGKTTTTDTPVPEKAEEEEAGTEKGARRMTRALKNQVLQQQVIDVDKALQILDEKTPPLVVDCEKLKELLQRVVTRTEEYEVNQLEKLYALLCQSIYRHRREHDKTALLQEMENEIEDFCN
ncbi:ATPase family AAA domain-containing protein 2 [Aplochiton taeniatus]